MSPGFWNSYLQVDASPTAAELPLRARGLQGLAKVSGMEPSAGRFYSDPGQPAFGRPPLPWGPSPAPVSVGSNKTFYISDGRLE